MIWPITEESNNISINLTQVTNKLNEVIDYLNDNAADRKQPAPLTDFTLDALKTYLAKELPYTSKLTEVLAVIGRFENGER